MSLNWEKMYKDLRDEHEVLVETLRQANETLKVRTTPAEAPKWRSITGLTRTMRRLLECIANDSFVSRHECCVAMYGDMGLFDRGPKVLDVHICKLRRALKPHGITFDTVPLYGFSMPAAERAKLKMLEAMEEEIYA